MTKSPSDGGPAPAAPGLTRHALFPTRVWQTRLTEFMPALPRWVGRIEALRAASPEPAGRSNRLGWNSGGGSILDQPDFAPLSAAIAHLCRLALGEMGVPDPAFKLDSWVNIHDRGGFNFPHMHLGALLSGCVYLQTPEGSGGLRFRDPRPGVVNSFAQGAGANACSDVELTVEPCAVVLFPVWLEHYVEPHAGDAPRIAIAFNAVLR